MIDGKNYSIEVVIIELTHNFHYQLFLHFHHIWFKY